ncbi:hypothetical protein ILYODFUR_035976 [Ilyodon furcidens]|uniref:Uncharacterized protein n=1 Tax=Ilyodon furcidens TaxID=33524 RepID=A0ABV0U1U9_9TELE
MFNPTISLELSLNDLKVLLLVSLRSFNKQTYSEQNQICFQDRISNPVLSGCQWVNQNCFSLRHFKTFGDPVSVGTQFWFVGLPGQGQMAGNGHHVLVLLSASSTL